MEVLGPLAIIAIPVTLFVGYLALVYIAAKYKAGFAAMALSGVVLILAVAGTWKISAFTTKKTFKDEAKRQLMMGFEQLRQDVVVEKTELVEAKINYLARNWNHVQYFNEDGGESLNEMVEVLMGGLGEPPKEFKLTPTDTAIPTDSVTNE